MRTNPLTLSVLAPTVLLALGTWAGFHINLTESVPIGLWYERPVKELKPGMIISVCAPALPIVKQMGKDGHLPYGYCPETRVAPFLKAVSAMPGDTVQIRRGFPALVNGKPLPNTEALPSLPAWPDGEYVVEPNQLWIFTYLNRGFDSRYFGPVDRKNVRGESIPVLIKE